MLELGRKEHERVAVNFNGAQLFVWWYRSRGKTRLCFEGPREVKITREELLDAKPQPRLNEDD